MSTHMGTQVHTWAHTWAHRYTHGYTYIGLHELYSTILYVKTLEHVQHIAHWPVVLVKKC